MPLKNEILADLSKMNCPPWSRDTTDYDHADNGKRIAFPMQDLSKDQAWAYLKKVLIRNNNIKKSENIEIEKLFSDLVETWRNDTAFLSSITDMVLHESYQRIIGLGQRAIPLILKELQHEPDQWFWALRAITGENPVKEEDAGNIKAMAEAWIHLGKSKGWL